MGSTASNHPAERFLLECVRFLFRQASADDLARRLAETDWGKVTERALTHQFAGTLYSMNRQRLFPAVPPDTAVEQWKQSITRQAMLQMVYQTEGTRLLSGLTGEGMDPVLLKGFARMQELYGDSATRSVSDMDILIRKEEFSSVKQYLLQDGYSLFLSDFYAEKAEEFEKFQASQNYEASFTKKVHGVPFILDVHWHMGSGWPGYEHLGIFDLDRIPWRELTEPFDFFGTLTRRLTPTAHFFHLISHFALHHRFSGFKWMHELCLFLSVFGEKLDWEWIHRQAEAARCRKVVGTTLRIVGEILGADHPSAGQWKCFWPNFMPGEYAFFRGRLFKPESQLIGAGCLLLLMDRPIDRFRLLGYLLFDPLGIPQLRLSSSSRSLPRRLLQPFYLLGFVAAAAFRHDKNAARPADASEKEHGKR